MDLISPSFYTHTNGEENALTFINFHLFDRKNNALAGHSAVHTQTVTAVKGTGCQSFVAENLRCFSPLYLLLSEHSADRLSVCSNQKFIQSCSGSPRLATAIRSPPPCNPLSCTLAIRTATAYQTA